METVNHDTEYINNINLMNIEPSELIKPFQTLKLFQNPQNHYFFHKNQSSSFIFLFNILYLYLGVKAVGKCNALPHERTLFIDSLFFLLFFR